MQISKIRLAASRPGIQRQFVRYILPPAVLSWRQGKTSPDICPFCPRIAVLPWLKCQGRPPHILPKMSDRIFQRPPLGTAHGNYAQTGGYHHHTDCRFSFSGLRFAVQHRKLCTWRGGEYAIHALRRFIGKYIVFRQGDEPHVIPGLLVRAAPAPCASAKVQDDFLAIVRLQIPPFPSRPTQGRLDGSPYKCPVCPP